MVSRTTRKGATRLDRIYVSQDIPENKLGAETLAAAFTAHLAVALRLSIEAPVQTHGKGTWRLNTSYLRDNTFLDTLKTNWHTWMKHRKYYTSSVLWWERYAKKMIRTLFIRHRTERKRERTYMENFYYETMYELLQLPLSHEEKSAKLKHLKEKIT
jgi:hypothetical protein